MSRKILIIEDDKFLRELMVRKLVNDGYEAIEATNGEEGVRTAKAEKPDLILLDLILPGIDGFESLTRIRKDQETANIPVIILSNLGQKEDIEKGLKLGATDYLIKAHFAPGEIAEKIASILK
ncbi:MAG: response regulator [Parcubacteria group bacterium CG10_big_fil_rev_8_21_14_0_10_35_15]|nr:MAG: response regulator [Parcubacteria group bacterium CG10_big_fil_rev_8_21_14_0_10_35_15]